ncbi:hypothetical protein GOODEAATRI_004643 [Goodea atripinnis]|uniref:Uncharacterized protein n=1 Tax=Goodea atripinnis TaxID=208336 RepID=A0ABV0NTH2_9TELE
MRSAERSCSSSVQRLQRLRRPPKDDRLLLREVFILLQQAQVVDELRIANAGFLFHGRHRRRSVGVSWIDELRPGQGPSARPGPREGLEIRVDLNQVWLLGRFRHGVKM